MESSRPGVIDLSKTSFVLIWRSLPAMALPFAILFTGFACLSVSEIALFEGRPPAVNLKGIAYSVFSFIVLSALTAILAVIVHRFVILEEINQINDVLRLSPVIAEFAVVTLILQLAFTALGLVSFSISSAGSLFVIVAVLAFVTAVYVSLRIFLIFPAIAVEAPGRNLRSAFRSGAGLIWPFLLAVLVCGLPILLASALVAMLFARGALFFGALGNAALEMALIATGVTVASQLYAWRVSQLTSLTEEMR